MSLTLHSLPKNAANTPGALWNVSRHSTTTSWPFSKVASTAGHALSTFWGKFSLPRAPTYNLRLVADASGYCALWRPYRIPMQFTRIAAFWCSDQKLDEVTVLRSASRKFLSRSGPPNYKDCWLPAWRRRGAFWLVAENSDKQALDLGLLSRAEKTCSIICRTCHEENITKYIHHSQTKEDSSNLYIRVDSKIQLY